jgi:hypothetical protein
MSGISTWLEGFPTSIYTDRRQDDFNLDGQLYDFPNRPIAGIKTKGFSHKEFLTGTFNQNAVNNSQRTKLAIHRLPACLWTKTEFQPEWKAMAAATPCKVRDLCRWMVH